MLQIKPKEYLPIVRQLADPSDTTTYYVRAYVYKHRGETESLLATLDLADQGTQRFTYHYEVPADAEGEGYYLSVITRVFTDSGYTTESPLYGRTEQTYLVAERWSMAFRGGGGADVDYKKVRRIVMEEIEKVSLPEPKEIDFEPVLTELRTISKEIGNIEIPKIKEADLKPVIMAVDKATREIKEKVGNIRIPELDLSPVMKSMEQIKGRQAVSVKSLNEYIRKVKQVLADAIEKIRIKAEKMETQIKSAPVVTLLSKKEKKPRSFL